MVLLSNSIRIKKQVSFFLIITSLLIIVFPLHLSAQSIIKLTLEKNTYLEDECIWFEAEEKNISNETVYSSIFRPGATSYCKVILKDTFGNELPYRGGVDFIPYKPEWLGYELKPGQNRYLVKDLHGIFGERDENHRTVFRLPPGHYFLQIILYTNYHWTVNFKELYRQYGSEAHNIADKRTVYSNIIEFDIIEPTGIEKEVHKKLLEAFGLRWQIKQGSTVHKQIFSILKLIEDDYPQSVYRLAAHNAMSSGIASNVGYRIDPKETLVMFKDRIYLNVVVRNLKNEIALQILPELSQEYPNSRLAKYIDYEYKYGHFKDFK